MSSRPQQVSSSNEASTVHQLNSPQDDFASISALRATGTQGMQHGLLGSGLSQDSMSMFSRSSGLPSQELLMRSREGLMNHLPMSMSSSLPSGSMSMGSSLPSTYPAVNSLNPSLLVRDSLINPELQFRGGLGTSDYAGGGTDSLRYGMLITLMIIFRDVCNSDNSSSSIRCNKNRVCSTTM